MLYSRIIYRALLSGDKTLSTSLSDEIWLRGTIASLASQFNIRCTNINISVTLCLLYNRLALTYSNREARPKRKKVNRLHISSVHCFICHYILSFVCVLCKICFSNVWISIWKLAHVCILYMALYLLYISYTSNYDILSTNKNFVLCAMEPCRCFKANDQDNK